MMAWSVFFFDHFRSYPPIGINLPSSTEDNVPCYIITLGIHSAAVHFGNGAVLNLSQFSLDLPAMLLIPIISTGYIPKRKNSYLSFCIYQQYVNTIIDIHAVLKCTLTSVTYDFCSVKFIDCACTWFIAKVSTALKAVITVTMNIEMATNAATIFQLLLLFFIHLPYNYGL
jgi:hypothetical protein